MIFAKSTLKQNDDLKTHPHIYFRTLTPNRTLAHWVAKYTIMKGEVYDRD